MLRRVQPGQPLGLERGQVLVCIPVYGALQLFAQSLQTVLRHTDPSVPILVADDCSPEPPSLEGLFPDREIFYWRQDRNVGFPRNCNDVFAAAAPADVVVLNSDCEVGVGWLEGLRDAAYCDTVVASATPLTNNGTIVSVPYRNKPQPDLPEGWDLEALAALLREKSLKLRPRIPTAIAHCTYFKRSALELVGGFDEIYSPGYGEEVDWSQRCVLRGLSHVVADDVFVLHHGSASFGTERSELQAEHHELNLERFPYYGEWVEAEAEAPYSQLARVVDHARRLLEGVSVTIDGSSLGPTITGTQVLTLETILALHRQGGLRLRVVVPRNFGPFARSILDPLALETLVWEDLRGTEERTDIVHRPAQIGRIHEFEKLRALGVYTIVSQLDFIAYRNPGYFDTFDEWQAYRSAARRTLAGADQVLFISSHSREEALVEGLLDPARAHVVYPGVDHQMAGLEVAPERPDWAAGLEGEFLLCFGVDFHHKNRLFALDLLHELRGARGWQGRLVLAGPVASPGSSGRDEDHWFEKHPDAAGVVTRVGSLPEPARRWLLANAALVVAPSVYEGFGLVPFEAADAGVACLYAPQASLAEVLPAEAAKLVPWDVAASADAVAELLADSAERARMVECVREASRRYTWEAAAEHLVAVYGEAVKLTPSGAWLTAAQSSDAADYRLLVPEKALRYWRQFGFFRGTWLGLAALRNRLGRRLRAGR